MQSGGGKVRHIRGKGAVCPQHAKRSPQGYLASKMSIKRGSRALLFVYRNFSPAIIKPAAPITALTSQMVVLFWALICSIFAWDGVVCCSYEILLRGLDDTNNRGYWTSKSASRWSDAVCTRWTNQSYTTHQICDCLVSFFGWFDSFSWAEISIGKK